MLDSWIDSLTINDLMNNDAPKHLIHFLARCSSFEVTFYLNFLCNAIMSCNGLILAGLLHDFHLYSFSNSKLDVADPVGAPGAAISVILIDPSISHKTNS